MAAISTTPPKKGKPAWVKIIAQYQKPVLSASVSQLANSFLPYAAVWALAAASVLLGWSYWITLGLAVLASGFLMRIFIIQHDCGHQSFFKSKKANDLTGFICGVLTMTPYEYWRTSHAIHHATAGNLDHRGVGDVYTMTVKEFLAGTPTDRFKYRMYRNPILMFLLAPGFMFMINQRTPLALPFATSKQGRRSLYYTDLAIFSLAVVLSLIIGFRNYLIIQIPINIIAATVGVWLFYIQHQFEEAYWKPEDDWDYTTAALKGSSYYKLPKVFQWFTGNIGLHHIHHLSPRIPNYLLEKVHNDNPEFQQVPIITLWASAKILLSRLALWDEDEKRLVSFAEVDRRQRAAAIADTANPTNTETETAS
ncbi:MAG: fatty acid desaturase [Chloroflexota bacterium]